MKVLIIGAAGMLGAKLAARLIADDALAGRDVERLILVDVVAPRVPEGGDDRVEGHAADLSATGVAERLLAERPDVVYHLAAIVSGEAEADLEKGYRINLDGTRHLLDAVRAEHEASGGGYVPRVVYSSSIAVFGAPFPAVIGDDFQQTPRTSYGVQKLMGELNARGLHAARHPRRHRAAPADDLRASGQAQRGRVGVLLRDPPGADRGAGGGAAGPGHGAPLVREPRARPSAFSCTPPASTASPSARAGT